MYSYTLRRGRNPRHTRGWFPRGEGAACKAARLSSTLRLPSKNIYGPVAQLVMRPTCNRDIGGSSPSRASMQTCVCYKKIFLIKVPQYFKLRFPQ